MKKGEERWVKRGEWGEERWTRRGEDGEERER